MPKTRRCDPALFERDLTGKTYIVTGANAGIGLETTRQLVRQGAQVVLACRRPDAAADSAAAIAHEGPVAPVVMPLDLGNLASVREFADAALERFERLDGLISNAGVMNTPQGRTADGFETQLGVNHMGHFLLTALLLERLKASAPSRIVNLASCFHDQAMGRDGNIHFSDLHCDDRPYDGWEAYAQSKLANVLHAQELGRRLDGTGVTAVSVHPGWVRTDLARHSMPLWVQNVLMRPLSALIGMIEPRDGAQTTLHCVLDDEVPQHNGAYYSQKGVYRDKSCAAGGWPMQSPNPNARDAEMASRLWEVSAKAVGLSN